MSRLPEFSGLLEGEQFNFIAVDNFTKAVVKRASVFFLSHYHTDHFRGLRFTDGSEKIEVSSIFRQNPDKILYCSHITRRLFINDDSSRIPEEQIVALSVGECVMVTGPEQDGKAPISVNVTLIPSGHILGAVMFLFEHENKRSLFTGDFRIYPKDISKLKQLHFGNGEVKPISHLYLDVTFGHSEYPTFPLRSEVSSELVQMISDWFKFDFVVHLDLPYKFAYENLLIDLSSGLKCRIAVDQSIYDSYYVYIPEMDDIVFPFTCNDEVNDKNKFKIHAVVGSDKRGKYCPICSRYKSYKVKTLRPCAQFFKRQVLEKGFVSKDSSDEYSVVRIAYASHCSLEELKAFVRYLKPKEIFSIVCHTSESVVSDINKQIFSLVRKSDEVDSPINQYYKRFRL